MGNGRSKIAVEAPARREEHSRCETDEQRRQPGWIGREIG
jgi:hypothetical protein